MVEPDKGKSDKGQMDQDKSDAGSEVPLTLAAFEALLDSHGADLNHWPEPIRATAQAFVASNKQARRALDYAAGLEHLISASPAPKPSASLIARIMDKTKS